MRKRKQLKRVRYLTLALDEDLYKLLDAEATRRHSSMTQAVRELILESKGRHEALHS